MPKTTLPKRNAKVLTLRARQNHAFLEEKAGKTLTPGETLPNGYVVPKTPKGKVWRVKRRSLYLERA